MFKSPQAADLESESISALRDARLACSSPRIAVRWKRLVGHVSPFSTVRLASLAPAVLFVFAFSSSTEHGLSFPIHGVRPLIHFVAASQKTGARYGTITIGGILREADGDTSLSEDSK